MARRTSAIQRRIERTAQIRGFGRRGLTDQPSRTLTAGGRILSRRQMYGNVRAAMGLTSG
jgi:hypothetical protein